MAQQEIKVWCPDHKEYEVPNRIIFTAVGIVFYFKDHDPIATGRTSEMAVLHK